MIKKSKTKFIDQFIRFLVISIIIIASLMILIADQSFFGSKTPRSVVKSSEIAGIPELTTILAASQEARLKATRTLVGRVGVESALEILKNSGLPYTGEGHLAVHQVGFYAYHKYGLDSILHCKDYFLYACYHGAIIEAATDQGFEAIFKMVDRCKNSSSRYFQCLHAAGHAILAIWDYDLPNALKTCDELFENKTRFPDTLSSCHNGAFMENLFGVHDWGVREAPKRDWLNEDPYFPCSAFGEKYQKGCWLNQAARIYQINHGNLQKTAQICNQLKNTQYKTWCFDNLARQIHASTEGSAQKVFELCQNVGQIWLENCIVVNAGAYYSVGDRQMGIAVCNMIWDSGKNSCFNLILKFITTDNLSFGEKQALCRKIEGVYATRCLRQI